MKHFQVCVLVLHHNSLFLDADESDAGMAESNDELGAELPDAFVVSKESNAPVEGKLGHEHQVSVLSFSLRFVAPVLLQRKKRSTSGNSGRKCVFHQ